jgi:3-methylcrotonyl-CoA carboxylase beta subunit
LKTLQSIIDPSSDEFRRNREYHQKLAEELRTRLEQVRRGGPEKYHQRHTAQGKLFVRERINRLLDPGAPFLELSPLAAWGVYEDQAPGAGIVTGIGG